MKRSIAAAGLKRWGWTAGPTQIPPDGARCQRIATAAAAVRKIKVGRARRSAPTSRRTACGVKEKAKAAREAHPPDPAGAGPLRGSSRTARRSAPTLFFKRSRGFGVHSHLTLSAGKWAGQAVHPCLTDTEISQNKQFVSQNHQENPLPSGPKFCCSNDAKETFRREVTFVLNNPIFSPNETNPSKPTTRRFARRRSTPELRSLRRDRIR